MIWSAFNFWCNTSDSMGNVCAECDSGESLSRHCLLLYVDRLAITIVRAYMDCATRTSRPDAISCDIPIAGEHENIVAKGLEIIGNGISGQIAFIMQHGRFAIGFLRQMAAKTTGIPRGMACNARHILVRVGTQRLIFGTVAPSHLIAFKSYCFGKVGSLVIIWRLWVNGVVHL